MQTLLTSVLMTRTVKPIQLTLANKSPWRLGQSYLASEVTVFS